jgi:glycerol-3-phosphate dehydrogenase subunit B
VTPPSARGHAIVIGSGAAGTAAALALAAAGHHVRIVLGGSGASLLTTGAIDQRPWETVTTSEPVLPLDPSTLELLRALDLYEVGPAEALVATIAGIVRPTRGIDRALLDLGRLPAGNVLIPRCDRHGWDATALARAWTDAPRARDRKLDFSAVDAQITRFSDERAIRDADIAARHDDEARLAWLGDRLREFLSRAAYVAVILPPWLGVERSRAAELSRALGIPCGEAVCGLAGPAGMRFDRARARAFAAAGVEVTSTWATRLTFNAGTWRVELEDGEPLEATAVVLATGGLVGGGLAYEPSGSMLASALPSHARPTFRSTVEAPVTIGAHGRPLDLPGSLFGVQPEAIAWPFVADPLLERAGVLASPDMRPLQAPAGLFACGELVADRPRAWLDAFATGARAGQSASTVLTSQAGHGP